MRETETSARPKKGESARVSACLDVLHGLVVRIIFMQIIRNNCGNTYVSLTIVVGTQTHTHTFSAESNLF